MLNQSLKTPNLDIEALDEAQLRTLVANCRRAKKRNEPIFLRALERLEELSAKGLSFDRTKAAILKAAKEGRLLSYKELADQSGLTWSMALHRAVGSHMYAIIEYAHLKVGP